MWFGKLSINVGIQERGYNGVNPTWLGFSYGSFLPHFHWNGGWFRNRECVDVGWYWFCFHGSVTWWGGNSIGIWPWDVMKPKKN